MRPSNREIKKRINLKKTVDLFRESGYLLPQNIEKKLKIPHSTLHGYLHELYEIGVIKEYKDGWAWVEYSDDEEKIKSSYEKLRKKFFGEPPLMAVAIEIKETTEKTKELLSKYTLYREPTEEEMAKSSMEIQIYLLWKCWIDQKLHERNFKKWGLEKGVEKLAYSGIDSNSFSKLIHRQDMPPINEVLEYSENIPEAASVDEKIEGSTAHYNFIWSEEAKTIFEILGGKLKLWDGKGMILLPRKLNKNEYNKYKSWIYRKPDYALDRIKDLARVSVPDDKALEDCLDWLKNPDFISREDVLSILRFFCINARDCEAIALEKEEAILEIMASIAFNEEVEEILRWESLNIIKIFDGEKVKERARKYCLETIKKGCESVNYLSEIVLWLSKNPEIEREIKGEVEQILMESNDEKIKMCAENFLKSIQSLQSAGVSSLYSGENSGGA